MMKEQRQAKPDVGTLPRSGGASLDKDGIDDEGYLEKKGTPSGNMAEFNHLPPGTDIEDQEVAHIEPQKMLTYAGGLSYPGDGGFSSRK